MVALGIENDLKEQKDQNILLSCLLKEMQQPKSTIQQFREVLGSLDMDGQASQLVAWQQENDRAVAGC